MAASPSKYTTASTMCSSTRGPAIWPSLVACPIAGGAVPAVGEADQLVGARAQPGGRARHRLDVVDVHRLDGIDRHELRGAAAIEGREDVARRDRGGHLHRGARDPEPGGAQPDLADRFLAAVVSDLRPRLREAAAACSTRVDLPMPGSPPISTVEPGTRPPRRPGRARRSAWSGATGRPTRRRGRRARRPGGARAQALGTAGVACSSASVFHAPQASQRPAHLAWTAPQLWQT